VALAIFVDSEYFALRRISLTQILVLIPFLYLEVICVNNVSLNKSHTESNLTKKILILVLKNV